MKTRRSIWLRGPDDERGSSLVEFALIAPLLFALLFGIIEFGIAFRDRLTVANGTQSAARVGATLGNEDYSDLAILQALDQSISELPNQGVGMVRWVDIYHADANGNPQSACVVGHSAKCNRYTYSPGFLPGCDWDPCPDPNAPVSYNGWGWDPTTRDVALPDLDVLGVRVSFAHDWVTGGLVPLPDVACDGTPATRCWADTAIMRIEPQVFEP